MKRILLYWIYEIQTKNNMKWYYWEAIPLKERQNGSFSKRADLPGVLQRINVCLSEDYSSW